MKFISRDPNITQFCKCAQPWVTLLLSFGLPPTLHLVAGACPSPAFLTSCPSFWVSAYPPAVCPHPPTAITPAVGACVQGDDIMLVTEYLEVGAEAGGEGYLCAAQCTRLRLSQRGWCRVGAEGGSRALGMRCTRHVISLYSPPALSCTPGEQPATALDCTPRFCSQRCAPCACAQGGDLRAALTADRTGRLGWYRGGKGIALDILRGLHFLHLNNVIHRGKPALRDAAAIEGGRC